MVNTNTRNTWNVEEKEVDSNFSYYQKLVEQLLENAYSNSRGFTTETDFNVSGWSNNIKKIPSSEVEVIGFKMNNTQDFVKKDVNEKLKEVGNSWGRKFRKSMVEPAIKSGKKWLKKHLL